jgi:hypothetical protein
MAEQETQGTQAQGKPAVGAKAAAKKKIRKGVTAASPTSRRRSTTRW